VKALCALIFVLSSLSIPAQAQNASMKQAPNVNDCCEPSTMAALIVATEPTAEEPSEKDPVTIIGSNEAEDVAVGATQRSDETRIAERSIRSDAAGGLTDEAIDPSTMSAQTVATERMVLELSQADHVMIIGPNEAKDVAVEALQPSDKIAEHSTRSDGELTDEATKPSTMPAQILATEATVEEFSQADQVVIIGPNEAKDISVEASDATEGIFDREIID
jgi:hypothetical protein